jgi:prepilin-type N-terminal cleavage/methylation domain-containing protein
MACVGRAARVVGFTIIEVIVVVVILGVLAAVAVPRLMAIRGSEAQAAAERIADLLSIAARRDTLTSQRLAVEFDGDAGELRLLTMSSPPDQAAAPSLQVWRVDRLAPVARLGDALLHEATAGSTTLDPRRWRVEFPQHTIRPALGLVVSDGEELAFRRIDLPSYGTRAVVTPGRTLSAGALEGAGFVDLDAIGQGDAAW